MNFDEQILSQLSKEFINSPQPTSSEESAQSACASHWKDFGMH